MNTTTNGYKGNALSDQPLEVQRAITAQYASTLLQPPAAAATKSVDSAHKFIDPALIQLFGNLLGQVIGAFTPAQKAALDDAAKFIDPALIRLLGNLFGQVIGAVTPQSKAMGLDKGEMKREYVLQNGHFEVFPTWSFWGETFVRLDNTGTVPTVAIVGDQRIHLNPGEGTTTSGRWAAFPVRVTNTSESPGAQLTVRVW
jgi:hypothetical protein